MGEHDRCSQPSGLLPNGLLPNASDKVVCSLDEERWSRAEEATARLIACIQPNQLSEERRNAVADYVQRLIMKCFPCQVFTFGSVPLKTYLPDGDIDLTAFCKNQNVKDTWATKVRDILESEEKNEDAEFHVKEVQYIQAEVKIIKCLVENIVVDISFNQLGGLCTLCFLEEVDLLINQNHLFKRSIILIKAWCYYESRILGAHHGLISTYALETLVLYIFHVFNNSFAGPLEILYRFLEFFSKFDWENFCVSLWGPVPISSLPDVTAEPPRKDSRELLFSKLFLDACSTVYAVFPGGQEIQGQTFISKHFNVIDPLRVNNNLGRSVNKGNFFRIRSAFAFGAKRLARLLDCPKADIASELNQFFLNTWERHGSGHRPDAPFGDLRHLSPSIPDHKHGLDNQISTSSSKKMNENTTGHDTEVVDSHTSCSHFSYRVNHPMESSSKRSDVCAAFDLQNQKSFGGLSNSRGSDDKEKCNQKAQVDKGQRSKMLAQMMDEAQGKNLVARTMSSPELYKYNNGASRVKFDKAADSGKCQLASTKMDDSRKMYLASEIAPKQKSIPSMDDSYTARSISSHQIHDLIADIDSAPDCCIDNSGVGSINVELTSSMGAQGIHQEEQDHVNMMAASMHRFGGQILMPLNLASAHVPLPLSSSMLASIGYAQRNLGGMVPPNIPFVSYGQFHQQGNETLVLPLMADAPHFGDKGGTSCGSFGPDDGTCQSLHTEDRKLSISTSLGPVSSYRVDESNSSVRVQHKLTKENLVSMREAPLDFYQHQGNRTDLNYPDDRILSSKLTASNASSQSKASSESSWNGSSGKETNTTREKLGRKTAISAAQYATSGKGKSISYHTSAEADYENQDWIMASTLGTEMAKRSMMTQGSLHVPRYYSSSLEIPQTSSSDSILPIPPMLLGPGSLHRVVDNGAVPIPFYATGPPVPFLTMVPVSYFPTETGASEASKSHLDEDIGLDGCGSGQTFDASVIRDEIEGLNVSSDMRSATATEQLEAHMPDILNSDILSHWQNLQYGRSCQSKRYPGPPICPSPVLVPPMYLQGSFPLDGPGSPLAANMNLFSQLMGYGPRVVPAAPLQSMSSQPDGAYQRHADELIELPRYRSGTGTYLPNPKASLSERHVSGMRRNNYNHDRGDHHRGDKEGNWSTNSKLRAAGRSRSHNRGQAEKPRLDRSESRADRPWVSRRHESSHPQQSQNSSLRHSSSHNAPGNTAYGMYPAHPNALLPNGPTIPSVVMLYPYDRGPAYSLPSDRLEFGSLGPVGFIGVGNNESSQIDGNHMRGLFEEHRFHEASVQHSSPDQPSSPCLPRKV